MTGRTGYFMYCFVKCAVLVQLLITVLHAQTESVLLPVVIQGKTGYVDGRGRIVIGPAFDHAGTFSEGLAPFKTTVAGVEKFGHIDQSGNVVIPPLFDGVKEFSEGLAVVRLNGKDGYISKSGEFLIQPRFKWAWS